MYNTSGDLSYDRYKLMQLTVLYDEPYRFTKEAKVSFISENKLFF